jgi:hypothetical protein
MRTRMVPLPRNNIESSQSAVSSRKQDLSWLAASVQTHLQSFKKCGYTRVYWHILSTFAHDSVPWSIVAKSYWLDLGLRVIANALYFLKVFMAFLHLRGH